METLSQIGVGTIVFKPGLIDSTVGCYQLIFMLHALKDTYIAAVKSVEKEIVTAAVFPSFLLFEDNYTIAAEFCNIPKGTFESGKKYNFLIRTSDGRTIQVVAEAL